MKTPLVTILLGISLLLAVGCGDRKSSSSQGATNASTTPKETGSSPLTAPVDYLGALGKAKESAIKTVDTSTLNHAVQIFRVEEGRNPKDLNELVEGKYLPRIPDAPYGMKLVYDANTGTVKVVKK